MSDTENDSGTHGGGVHQLKCSCGWSFEPDTPALAYKRRISHEDVCGDGEWIGDSNE